MGSLHIFSLIFCIFFDRYFADSSGDLLRGIFVPKYSFVGDSATLSCNYNLGHNKLYSLKWYHNRTEFYRYVPTERKRPVNVRPTPYYIIHEVSRSSTAVVLKLSRLSQYASGIYRCELIAEHPSFRTESVTASMTVLKERLFPPIIIGFKEMYESEDLIELQCRPLLAHDTSPSFVLNWYLDNKKVTSKLSSDYEVSKSISPDGQPMVELRLKAKEVLDAGGSIKTECRLMLGSHREVTSKVLRVRAPVVTSVDGLISKGTAMSQSFVITTIVLNLLYYVVS